MAFKMLGVSNMRVEEVMQQTSLKFYVNQKVLEVLSALNKNNLKGGLVYDQYENLVGAFSVEQIYQFIVEGHTHLTNTMFNDFVILKESDSILSLEYGTSQCNPIKNENEYITGILTRNEYLLAYTKAAQTKLSYYDAIFDSTHNGILSIDSLGEITSINPPAVKMANTSKEEAIGKFLSEVVLPTGLLEVLRTGKGHTEKYQAGNRMYISNRSPIIQDDEIVGAVGVFQDISEIEFVSNELQSVKKIVNELNAIIDNSSDGICVVDHEYEIQRMNSCFKKMVLSSNNKTNLPKQIIDLVNGVAKSDKEDSVLYRNVDTNNSLIITCTPIKDFELELERFVIHVKDMTEMEMLRDELEKAKRILSDYNLQNDEGFIYRSHSMKQLVNMVHQVAKTDATVLLTGESGVGKGEVANLIKLQSQRRDQPFIQVNCAAIPETLIESELFGYEAGAFTGASSKGKKGYFEQADNGTIFLDEVGELPPSLQVKLLSVLQDGQVTRLGSEKPTQINVRIIAATNRNLEKMIESGRFREDLYYRLNVVPLLIPPLRNRIEDIPVLVQHFSEVFSKQYNKKLIYKEDAIKALMQYEWPGNVRELVNIIERSAIISTKDKIGADEIYQLINLTNNNNNLHNDIVSIDEIIPLRDAIYLLEKQLILKTIEQEKTYRKAAKLLGVNVSTISRKMKQIEKDMNR